ncbi:MAG TPA: hypothetical protein VF007_10765 [Stellaceae bacterium]
MFVPTKLLLIALLVFVAWYAMRWVNRPAPTVLRRRPTPPKSPQAVVENLTACRICGAYVASSARACGEPACPQPR